MTSFAWQMPRLEMTEIGSVLPIYGMTIFIASSEETWMGGRLADKREARFERVRGILEYEVPLVRMVDHSFDNAVDAFTRINTLGVRLKVEDIESAKVAARHSGFIADEVVPFLEKI